MHDVYLYHILHILLPRCAEHENLTSVWWWLRVRNVQVGGGAQTSSLECCIITTYNIYNSTSSQSLAVSYAINAPSRPVPPIVVVLAGRSPTDYRLFSVANEWYYYNDNVMIMSEPAGHELCRSTILSSLISPGSIDVTCSYFYSRDSPLDNRKKSARCLIRKKTAALFETPKSL